ncbi:MAG: DUF1499 domain-containing protein [Acidobacteria bacterium]|nr:MAG: DUF1499 domain-containing protein [Acidobacteriota bacterium]PYQ24229.1 MAG: DUF1499 domain-containing protein [Acidobacteriota bacterium]
MEARRGAAGVIAVAAVTLSVVALAVLLAAGPGTRIGWWSFRTGLGLLRWAFYGGVAGAALALIAVVGGGRRALAALGLLVGVAAMLPPWQFQRMARSRPPIHDISTDTDDPPRFVAVVPLRQGGTNPVDYGGPAIAAQQREAYPDIAPATLALPPARAFEHALQVARAQGWQVVAAAPAEGRIEATDTTRWFGFKDDIVIRVRPEGAGSRVDVRSVSRVGRGDVGTNARRIRDFLKALAG